MLDANIIIEAHTRAVWASLVARGNLVIPSTVLAEANCYYEVDGDDPIPIHLEESIAQNKVRVVSADAVQLATFLARFDRVFVERMDDGEAEALALLSDGTLSDHMFCTGDGPAIRALTLLGMSEYGISLEKLLRQEGLSRAVARPFTERFFKEQIARGAEELVCGTGLRTPPPTPQKPRKNATTNRSKRSRGR